MTKLTVAPPTLVAHRGYSGRYPENTLIAYQAAVDHGAKFVELDLQLTHDEVPVLHHDLSLKRLSGVEDDVTEVSARNFESLPAAYAERFGDEFEDNRFISFEHYCEWLKKQKDVTTFVEIKQESISEFGEKDVFNEVLKRIENTKTQSQCVIISFNHEILHYAREVCELEVGWVLPKWNDDNQAIANELKPGYLFSSKTILPEQQEDVWQGNWRWVIYNLDDVPSAIEMANRGFDMLETNQIGTLIADPRLGDKTS